MAFWIPFAERVARKMVELGRMTEADAARWLTRFTAEVYSHRDSVHGLNGNGFNPQPRALARRRAKAHAAKLARRHNRK